MSYFLPTKVLAFFNSFLQTVGTTLVIIPLTIIILSFLFPENYGLKIMSSFFGVASTLITIMSGIYKNSLGETYNMKLFIVRRIIPFNEKCEIFQKEFLHFIEEKYKNNVELYTYLQEHLLEKHFEIYKQKIESLQEALAIKLYANEIIQQPVATFLQQQEIHLKTQALTYVTVLKVLAYVSLDIIGTVLVATILRTIFESDKILEGAKLAKDTATLSAENTDMLTKTQVLLKDLIEILNDKANPVAKAIFDFCDIQIKEITQSLMSAFEQYQQKFNKLEDVTAVQTEILNDLSTKINHKPE